MPKNWIHRNCIRCNAGKPHVKNGFSYTYCVRCLRETQLGPYKKRLPLVGEEYSQW